MSKRRQTEISDEERVILEEAAENLRARLSGCTAAVRHLGHAQVTHSVSDALVAIEGFQRTIRELGV